MRYHITARDLLRNSLYAILFIICFLLQTVPGFLPKIFGVSALPLIPAVVCIAMQELDTAGAVYGLIAGLLMDVNTVEMPGFNALILMAAGCAVGLFITFLIRKNLLSAFVNTTAVLFAYLTLHWLFFYVFKGYGEPPYYYLRYQLPVILYTLLFLPPLYLFTGMIHRRLHHIR